MTPALARTLSRALDVRPGEGEILARVVGAAALAMAALYVLKPARSAIFLEVAGVAQLPYVLMLVAATGAVSALSFARLAGSLRPDRLVRHAFFASIVVLVAFRIALPHGTPWLAYAFYAWVGLYGLVGASLVWLVAGLAFDARQARRLFGVLGGGATLGAVSGGLCASSVARTIGTENLLLVAAALVFGAALLFGTVPAGPPSRAKRTSRAVTSSGPTSVLVGSVAIAAALAAAVAVIVDIQFNDVVDRAYASRDDKAAFFGTFFALLNAAMLVVQLLVTRRAIATLGVGGTLTLLPLALLTGSVAFVLAPTLLTAIAAKSADGGLRHSVHKAASEVLLLPIPASARGGVKLFIDGTVDALATGAAALFVLVVTSRFGISYAQLGVVSAFLCLLWLLISWRERAAYVEAFRRAIERREIDPEELQAGLRAASSLGALRQALASDNEKQLLYALDVFASVRDEDARQMLRDLLGHASPKVRAGAIAALAVQEDPSCLTRVEELVSDGDEDVRCEAVGYVCRFGADDPVERISGFLRSKDPLLRTAALGSIVKHGDELAHAVVDEATLRACTSGEGPGGLSGRVLVARALATLGTERFPGVLSELLADASPEVVAAAIETVGRLRDADRMPWLVARLTHRDVRFAAGMALAQFGIAALPFLRPRLESESSAERREALRALGRIPHADAIDLLLGVLEGAERDARSFDGAVRALSKIRASDGHLRFPRRRVLALLEREARDAYADVLALRAFGADPPDPETRLVKRALRERLDAGSERIFRLLGLVHSPRDMHAAHHRIESGSPALRAGAVEFLDNTLDKRLKGLLLPFIEHRDRDEGVRHALQHSHREITEPSDAFQHLSGCPDGWLRACSLLAQVRSGNVVDTALWAQDPDRRVREVASGLLGERG